MSNSTTTNALAEEAATVAGMFPPGTPSYRVARLCRRLVARTTGIYTRLRSTEDSIDETDVMLAELQDHVKARLRALETSLEDHGKTIRVIAAATEPMAAMVLTGQHDTRIDALEIGLTNLRQDYTSALIKNGAANDSVEKAGQRIHGLGERVAFLEEWMRDTNANAMYAIKRGLASDDRIREADERIAKHGVGLNDFNERLETLEAGLTAARTDIRQAAAAGLFSRPADPAVFESRMAGIEDELKASSGEIEANIRLHTERVLAALHPIRASISDLAAEVARIQDGKPAADGCPEDVDVDGAGEKIDTSDPTR